jgi:hypothetical protein
MLIPALMLDKGLQVFLLHPRHRGVVGLFRARGRRESGHHSNQNCLGQPAGVVEATGSRLCYLSEL